MTPLLKAQRILISWDALYCRLNSNFDGRGNAYCACPKGIEGSGKAQGSYEVGMGFRNVSLEGQNVLVHVDNLGKRVNGRYAARRLLLVGDAQTLFRLHIASSTDQAAFDCLCLES